MPKTIKEHIKKAGRQSKNIEDLRDRNSKAFKIADGVGKVANKAFKNKKLTAKSLPEDTVNTRNKNLMTNGMRQAMPKYFGLKVKNVKLDSPKQSFSKKK